MNRRGFLSILASAVPAALIVPELLLPKRTFFLPPAAGWSGPIIFPAPTQGWGKVVAYVVGDTISHVGPDDSERRLFICTRTGTAELSLSDSGPAFDGTAEFLSMGGDA